MLYLKLFAQELVDFVFSVKYNESNLLVNKLDSLFYKGCIL